MLPPRVTVLAAACQQWTEQPNTYHGNGQANTAANVEACKTACIDNTACNGFDWAPTWAVGQQCWLSGTWSGAIGTWQGTHYHLDRHCAGNKQKNALILFGVVMIILMYSF